MVNHETILLIWATSPDEFIIKREDKMSEVKYPKITVKLVGKDGNIFNLMGLVQKAMREAGVPKDDRSQFLKEVSFSNSYDQALQVIMRWVKVE